MLYVEIQVILTLPARFRQGFQFDGLQYVCYNLYKKLTESIYAAADNSMRY